MSDTQSKISESCKKGQPFSPNCTCKSGNTLILPVKTESVQNQNKRFSKRSQGFDFFFYGLLRFINMTFCRKETVKRAIDEKMKDWDSVILESIVKLFSMLESVSK